MSDTSPRANAITIRSKLMLEIASESVSYTHLRAHET
jgi:hypothetical protein